MSAKLWIIIDIENNQYCIIYHTVYLYHGLFIAEVQMYFIRQLLQGQLAMTQQNLQNECIVKTDQIARIRRLMSIFTSSYAYYLYRIHIFESNNNNNE